MWIECGDHPIAPRFCIQARSKVASCVACRMLRDVGTTMGGCLWLTPVRANRREEIEESPKFDTSGDHEPSNNAWSYRYSGIQWLKGHALRAGIQYLESIQKQVDERKSAGPVAGSGQFLSDAGIIAAATSPTDAKALEDACTAIPAAVRLLRDWIREPELDQWGAMTDRDAAGTTLDNMLNSNFRFGELAKHDVCPPALHRVGLVGLFLLAKMWDNNQFIYPYQARVMAGSLSRVFEFLDAEWKEMAGELRDLLRKCGEDEMSMIQG
ncbi:hypothetical protein LXA43DRAFT_1137534 [Ganoderma leucocontextum]|nr:hypothetical protein LXA43DRAFT_1137534 [Ganoderma leucocontextum]